MYAQLGNRIYNHLITFIEFSKAGTAVYPEHATLDGKPKLQRTGLALHEITLSFRFHAAYCNPVEELEALRLSRDQGEILPLLWGNGKLEGEFVITGLSEIIEMQDPLGNVFSYLVNCNLKEFVLPNKLQQEQDSNRNNGVAVGDKKAIARLKENPVTCAHKISRCVGGIENHQQAINKIVLEKGGGITIDSKATIRKHLLAIGKLCKEIMKRNQDPNSCLKNYPGIAGSATLVDNESGAFIAELWHTPERIPNDNRQLDIKVKNLKKATYPLINQTITRK